MKYPYIITALAVVAISALVGSVYLQSLPNESERSAPAELRDILLPESRRIEPFSLIDSQNEVFDLSRLQGKWTLIFFGYTHCPDICPTTLATLGRMAKDLQQKSPRYYSDTQFVFVSVDPKRDTTAHLAEYVDYFHPDFLAATGEKDQIDRLARRLGTVYMFEGDTGSDDYLVNHSAGIVVIDPRGHWAARFNAPHKAAEMAENFRRLRDYFQR
ncbi:MAG: SCO family protein [Pseudomonadota bacterium]